MINPRPYQNEAVQAVFDYFNAGHAGHPIIVAPTGCHAKGTLILMHNGSIKPVEDIQVGDLLMGPDSSPRQVLQLARGNEMMYKITPKKGDSFVVNEGHILSLQTTNEGKPGSWNMTGSEISNITVADYLKKSKSWKHLRKLRKVAVDFPDQPAPKIPSWHMGILLGDGSLKRSVCITTMDDEVKQGVIELAEIFSTEIRISKKSKTDAVGIFFPQKTWTRSTQNPVVEELVKLGAWNTGSTTKFIPDQYKLGSKNERLNVLAGLLDSDGYLCNANTFEITSKSRRLADDVVFVARSLGFSACAKSCQKRDQDGRGGEYFRVHISGDTEVIPVRIPRKKAQPRMQKKDVKKLGFSIEPIGNGDFFGFSLTGDHLYLSADFIVHHNTGKSVMIAALIQRILADYPTTRVMVLTHVKELLQQNAEKLLSIWNDAPMGMYSAGLGYADTESPILFCGIQSVWKKAKALASETRPIELVFIDECHRVPTEQHGTYRRFIRDLTALNPYLRLIGLTATPFRYVSGTKTHSGGYQLLTQGEDRLFTDVVCDLSTRLVPMIHDNYLAALWPQPTTYRVNLDGIKIQNGDYREDQLNTLMSRDDVLEPLLSEAVAMAQADNRKHWLVFCAGVDQAHLTTEWLLAHGISAACITGSTASKARAQAILDFKYGKLTALVSVGVLTVGFDSPNTDCLIIARPTISPVLWVQMCGRGMRPTPEKNAIEDGKKRGCLVLDFVGNCQRHGAIDQLKLKAPAQKIPKGDRKECPQCKTEISRFANPCPECGHEFPVDEVPVEIPKAGKDAIIAGITPLPPPIRYEVSRVAYSKHVGKSGIPTLRVDYFDGWLRVASEWVCLEHTGYARQKAVKWAEDRWPEIWQPSILCNGPIPSIDKALELSSRDAKFRFKEPTAIHVRQPANRDQYPEIVKYEWAVELEVVV